MTFRPYPILTLLTLPALAFLIWLGSWQLDRRAWKAELIAAFEASAEAPPVGLEETLCAGSPATGQRVDMNTVFPSDDAVKVYGTGPEGAPGWRIFAPVLVPACDDAPLILAETAFEPLETAMRGGDGRTAERSVVQSLRFETPAPRGPFTPADSPGQSEFYAFDAGAMAVSLGFDAGDVNADWWLAADDGSLPAYLTQTPPERHVGYAVTWFLMAAALIAVYLLFHVRAGRLTLRR
ncbi:MAG: SURF1 family protein [Alphaproteobacteria bacterium]|nr:SURF1 family protein [Alphaproteobacteria bacterium]